jgi:hypothetical protein
MFNAIIGLWVPAGLIIGFAMPSAVNLATTPIAFFHVPMAVSMLIMFLVAAVYGVMWLRTRRENMMLFRCLLRKSVSPAVLSRL